MASIQELNALKQTLINQINTAFASVITKPVTTAGDDSEAEAEPEVKLTPIQKLEKQLETAQEKLDKLNEKIAGGKSKIPDKDEENKTKFEEMISKINEKIAEANAKEAKKAKKPAPAKAKAVVVEKAANTTEAKVEVKKHVPRITPAMTTKLKEAFETVGAEWNDEHKKGFVTAVNALSEEEFTEFGLEGHMSKYANDNAPAPKKGGGGGAEPAPKVLSLPDLLKQKKNLEQVSVGVFRHKTTGERVTGPEEDADEEFEEKDCDDVTYIVGETTKRVYKPTEDGPDEFVGYWGIGNW